MKKFTKAVRLIHRYLGLALSLIFVLWFLSGIMMMYVTYPTLKSHEKHQRTAPIDLRTSVLTPGEALQKAGLTDTMKSIRLGMVLDRPVYRMKMNEQSRAKRKNPPTLSGLTRADSHWIDPTFFLREYLL